MLGPAAATACSKQPYYAILPIRDFFNGAHQLNFTQKFLVFDRARSGPKIEIPYVMLFPSTNSVVRTHCVRSTLPGTTEFAEDKTFDTGLCVTDCCARYFLADRIELVYTF